MVLRAPFDDMAFATEAVEVVVVALMANDKGTPMAVQCHARNYASTYHLTSSFTQQ